MLQLCKMNVLMLRERTSEQIKMKRKIFIPYRLFPVWTEIVKRFFATLGGKENLEVGKNRHNVESLATLAG